MTEMSTNMGYDLRYRCLLCNAPIEGAVHLIPLLSANELDPDTPVCRECSYAWWNRDKATLLRRRMEACAAGHHKWPGRWLPDPADPYGDAGYWECTHGCGYVSRHPGYGIGRQMAELEAAGKLPKDDDAGLLNTCTPVRMPPATPRLDDVLAP